MFGALMMIFGISVGLQTREWLKYILPGNAFMPSGEDIITKYQGYPAVMTVALAALGLILGLIFGLKLADRIVGFGRALETMSAADKIASGLGVLLGAVASIPIYLLVFQIQVNTGVKLGVSVLLSAIVFYLVVVATTSMGSELMNILSRGGAVMPASEAEMSPTAGCKILDTNVIIDGRIAEVCRTGFLEGPLYVPGFVLDELQHIADSGDALKRARGRRGLDILNNMQKELPLIVRSWDKMLDKSAERDEVDTRLVKLAKALEGVIVTNDFNLNKVAMLQGVQVLNVNELANVLKPVVLPGEVMRVGIVKEGKEPNQGVAYLDDGTMIVIEDGRKHMNETMNVIVNSVLQTAAGKMIFARVRTDEDDEEDYQSRIPRNDGGGSNGGGASYNTGGSNYTRRGPSKKVR